jgi:hypothetical protein
MSEYAVIVVTSDATRSNADIELNAARDRFDETPFRPPSKKSCRTVRNKSDLKVYWR